MHIYKSPSTQGDRTSTRFLGLFGISTLRVEDCFSAEGVLLHRSFVQHYRTYVELDSADYLAFRGNLQDWFSTWSSLDPPISCFTSSERACAVCSRDGVRSSSRVTESVLHLPRVLIVLTPTTVQGREQESLLDTWESIELSEESKVFEPWSCPLSLNIPGSSFQYERLGLVTRDDAHYTSLLRPLHSSTLVEYDDLVEGGFARVRSLSKASMDEHFGGGAPSADASVYVLVDADNKSNAQKEILESRARIITFAQEIGITFQTPAETLGLWFTPTPRQPNFLDKTNRASWQPSAQRYQHDFVLHDPSDHPRSPSPPLFQPLQPFLHEPLPPNPPSSSWAPSSTLLQPINSSPFPSRHWSSLKRTSTARRIGPYGRSSATESYDRIKKWLNAYREHPICMHFATTLSPVLTQTDYIPVRQTQCPMCGQQINRLTSSMAETVLKTLLRERATGTRQLGLPT